MAIPNGKVISHYRILEKLGEGGMGIVYKTHDTKLDRLVALKFLPPHLTTSETDKARFMQEAKAASAINHPNVCIIHDIQEHEGQQFIVMEYVDGVMLKDKFKDTLIGIKEVIDYAIQIAEALKAAHSKGIVHRDIKSENIMVTDTNQVKVMDFGLAKLRGEVKLTKTSSTFGTVAYMAPEHIQDQGIDARSDIFSFGVVLYEMLTGQLPFKGEYDSAMMYAIVNEEPEPVQKHRTDLSSEFLHVLNRALEKDPEDRYQSVNDMLIDLKRLKRDTGKVSRESLKEMPVSHVPEKPEAARIKSKKKPFWIGIGTIAILFIFSIWFISQNIFRSQHEPVIGKVNSIAVMYFENRSGEPDLGKILVNMLTTNLSRYKEIDVVSSQRLFDILKLIGKEDLDAIDKHVATEVATRAQVKTMLLGDIMKIGNKIRINAQLCDVNTGSNIGSEYVEGTKVEDIFDMVDQLTERVRNRLGISGYELGEQLIKIVDVTTSSFEAYKHYQKGVENIWRFAYLDAEKNFENAISIDSTLAMAHLQLAQVKFARAFVSSVPNFTPVFKSLRLAKKYSAKVTDKERLFIDAYTAMYNSMYNKDYETAETIISDFVNQYPDDKEGLFLLSSVYWFSGKFEKQIHALERVLEIDPTYANIYNRMAYCYSWNEDHKEAISAVKKYLALQPDVFNTYDSAWEIFMKAGRYDEAYYICEEALEKNSSWLRFYRYTGYIYLLRGKGEKAREKFLQMVLHDTKQEIWTTFNFGYSYLFEGRYREALTEFRRALELSQKINDKEWEVEARIEMGKTFTVQGNYSKALEEFSEAKKSSTQIYGQAFNPFLVLAEYFAGIAMIQKGNYKEAQVRVDQIRTYIEENKFENLYLDFSKILNAEIQLAQGNVRPTQIAITNLSPLSFRNPIYYTILAATYVLQGDLENAINTYKQFYDAVDTRKYFMGDYFYYFVERSKVNYNLAKIYEQEGDRTKSIEYYQKAIEQWKNADGDLPELMEAKARIAELKGITSP